MMIINKSYIQDSQRFEEKQDAFLKIEDLKETFGKKTQQISLNKFIPKMEALPLKRMNKLLESLELIKFNSKLEIEIEKSSLRLDKMKEVYNCVDISEETWNFSKNLLQKISKKFLVKLRKEIPIPKINFIEESIEIRWIKDKFKLILSITDYFSDIIIYVKTRNGQYLSEPVPRDDIFNWVLFWLNQI